MSRALWQVTWLLWGLVLLGTLAGAASPSAEAVGSGDLAFVVAQGQDSTVAVTSKDASGRTLVCTFGFSTQQPVVPDSAPKVVVASVAPKVQPEGIVDGLSVQPCLTISSGIFVYEVCPGRTNKQTVSGPGGTDVFSLGSHQVTEKDAEGIRQQFDGGTTCDAVGGSPPRRSVVRYVCSEALIVISVAEPQTCRYEFIVGVPALCQDGQMPVISGPGGQPLPASARLPSSLFLLSLDTTLDGRSICTLSTSAGSVAAAGREAVPFSRACLSLQIDKGPEVLVDEAVWKAERSAPLSREFVWGHVDTPLGNGAPALCLAPASATGGAPSAVGGAGQPAPQAVFFSPVAFARATSQAGVVSKP